MESTQSMKALDKLKLCTGIQLAVTLILGVIALHAGPRHILGIGLAMFVVVCSVIGRFLFAGWVTPRELPAAGESRNRGPIPWLLPEA